MIEERDHKIEEIRELVGTSRGPSGESMGIHLLPIALEGDRQTVEQPASRGVRDLRRVEQIAVISESPGGAVEPPADFVGEKESLGAVANERGDQHEMSAQLAHRHHRQAVPHQGVVRVVPLGRWVFIQMPPSRTRWEILARMGTRSFSARLT